MDVDPLFLKFAAVCAIVYGLLPFLQNRLTSRAPKITDFDSLIARETHPAQLLRYRLTLLAFFPIIIAYVALLIATFARAPAFALLGFVFCLVFAFCEMLYRSVELFAVIRVLMAKYLAETDAAAKATLQRMIEAFQDGVIGVYFVLLSAHMLGSVFFALTLWRGDTLSIVVALLWLANAVRLLLRLLQLNAGQKQLGRLNNRIYAPLVALTYVGVGIWLWNAG